jgi:hypothetical protein
MKHFFILLIVLTSCGSSGPNYNQGSNHNSSQQKRVKIVMHQDQKMRRKMNATRNRCDKKRHYRLKKRKKYSKFV